MKADDIARISDALLTLADAARDVQRLCLSVEITFGDPEPEPQPEPVFETQRGPAVIHLTDAPAPEVGAELARILARNTPSIVRQAAATEPVAAAAPDQQFTGRQWKIVHHIRALGYPGWCTPEADLMLCERLWRGVKLRAVAEGLGVDWTAARDRFHAITKPICGDNAITPQAQADILAVLRFFAEAV